MKKYRDEKICVCDHTWPGLAGVGPSSSYTSRRHSHTNHRDIFSSDTLYNTSSATSTSRHPHYHRPHSSLSHHSATLGPGPHPHHYLSYTGGRVPPTPPSHVRPFSRSSSVPEQYLADPEAISNKYDYLLKDYHTPLPSGSVDKDPLSWKSLFLTGNQAPPYGTSSSARHPTSSTTPGYPSSLGCSAGLSRPLTGDPLLNRSGHQPNFLCLPFSG